ncbi:MAG: ComEC/Rec2 family competence protein, partial [Woeseia sp.]
MLGFCLCVLAGAYTLQFSSQLPDKSSLVVLATLSLVALVVSRTRFAGAYLSGLVLMAYNAHGVIDDRLTTQLAADAITFDARIADFPKDNGTSLSFLVKPISRDGLPGRIRLSWFDASSRPRVGETWRFEARLRRPRGFSNPGGFDYEAWLFRQSIGATGYVVEGPHNLRQAEPVDGISRLRQRFVSRVEARLPRDDASAVVMAVAVGARHAITRGQWNRYAATGTSHLMAISGLHIGLAAGGVFVLSWIVLSFSCRRGNIRDRAAVIAMLAAYSYTEISGFAVPAKRALLMTIIVVLAGLIRRRVSASRLLASCCLAILVTDPLAILAPGFKLSFAAVAILFWHLRVRTIRGYYAGNRVVVSIWNFIRT